MSNHHFTADERGLVRTCPQCGTANRLTYERLGHRFRCASCKSELSAPDETVEIPSAGIFDALIAHAAQPVLVDFWAPWCGPCRMIAPELEKVARSASGRWLVVKANTESLADIAARHRITGIPTLVLFQKGRETARQSGVMPAPAVVQFVQSNTTAD